MFLTCFKISLFVENIIELPAFVGFFLNIRGAKVPLLDKLGKIGPNLSIYSRYNQARAVFWTLN